MLKQIQAVTGTVFAVFLTLHLLNTWLAALGPATYDGVQSVLRTLYQFTPFEAMLLAALVVHVISGLLRICIEPKRELTPRSRWHRISGIFLLLFIGGHITAVRGASWFYDVYPGFEGLAFSISAVPTYFYPYYFLLGVAGLYHGLNGLGIALGRLGFRTGLSTSALVRVTAAGAVLTLLALGGLGGWYYDVGAVQESEFAVLTTRIAAEVFGVSLTP